MHKRPYVIPKPPRPDVTEAYLVFNIGFDRMRMDLHPTDKIHTAGKHSNVVRVPMTKGRPAARSIDLASSGDPPEVAKIVYRLANGGSLVLGDPDTCPKSNPPTFVYSGRKPEEHVFDVGRWNESLGRSHGQEGSPSRLARYRRYFATLERETNPKVFPSDMSEDEKERRQQALKFVFPFLENRFDQRAAAGKRGRQPELEQLAEGTETLASVTLLSQLQARIIRDHFGTGNRLVAKDYEEAFEMFANGELRVRLDVDAWTTQPSSWYFFFFAEFAFLCIDQRIDAAFWQQLVNVHVRSQKMFMRVYCHKGTRGGIDDYHACNYDEKNRFTALERQELAADFRKLGYPELSMAAASMAAEAVTIRAARSRTAGR